jgi:hypothetical protein
VQDAVTIGELQVFVRHPDDFSIPEDIGPVEDFDGFAAVGSGVHVYGAADGAGDAGGELQPGEAAGGGGISEDRVEDASIGGDAVPVELHVRKRLGEPDGEAADAAIEDEDVRAAPEDGDGDAMIAGFTHGGDQFLRSPRLQERVGGAAYLPGRIAPERFVELGRREELL